MAIRVAKQKCKKSQDGYKAKYIKDEMGRPLYEENNM